MQVQITGDHILLSCNGLPHDENHVDVLFLVSWKEGKVTSVGYLHQLCVYIVNLWYRSCARLRYRQ